MTRGEAINIISQMIKDEEGFLSDNTVEAHKMAIQALSQELIPDKIKNENAKLCKELKKARKEKKRWKKKYIELRDGKKSIELARIEDGLGLEPILYR